MHDEFGGNAEGHELCIQNGHKSALIFDSDVNRLKYALATFSRTKWKIMLHT